MAVIIRGIVVAVHGKETDAGDFMVKGILEAGLPPQIKRPLNSGLSVGSSLLILSIFSSGHLGDEKGVAAQIVQVVIAGNSVEIHRGLLNGQVVAGIPFDIMPGTNDPANFSLPRQMHDANC
ncbi:DNA polymerase delta subunit 2 [Orobanche minor]